MCPRVWDKTRVLLSLGDTITSHAVHTMYSRHPNGLHTTKKRYIVLVAPGFWHAHPKDFTKLCRCRDITRGRWSCLKRGTYYLLASILRRASEAGGHHNTYHTAMLSAHHARHLFAECHLNTSS